MGRFSVVVCGFFAVLFFPISSFSEHHIDQYDQPENELKIEIRN